MQLGDLFEGGGLFVDVSVERAKDVFKFEGQVRQSGDLCLLVFDRRKVVANVVGRVFIAIGEKAADLGVDPPPVVQKIVKMIV